MGRVMIPRPRLIRGLRQSSIVVEGSIVTSSLWDSDVMTYAYLCYITGSVSGFGVYTMREGAGPIQVGFNPMSPDVGNVAARLVRARSGTDLDLGDDGTSFGDPTIDRFVWFFVFDHGAGNLPTMGYCMLGDVPAFKTTGFVGQIIPTGTPTAMPNPYTYGSRDNQDAFFKVPFYATAMWQRALSREEVFRLAQWDVPLDPILFVFNDTGLDLSGNGHNVTFNDLEQNRVDNTFPALRIPAR